MYVYQARQAYILVSFLLIFSYWYLLDKSQKYFKFEYEVKCSDLSFCEEWETVENRLNIRKSTIFYISNN